MTVGRFRPFFCKGIGKNGVGGSAVALIQSRKRSAKTTLPLPAPPPKKSPQMAFDFNAVACKEVAAQELNLEVRDEYGLNKDLKVFEVTRIYCYKILTLILGLPIAFIAGLIFALFSFLRIWIIQPCLALVRIALAQALTIWPMFLLYIVRPLFYSVGAMFSTFRLHRTEGQVIKEVWERV
ncbi:unnamed protein product [Heligmosomoides polygyrus]|uniref:Caveolin n=1 Tax=Heligmosomoides polygyrus TaxID=6339 RepID=A0A183FKZ6_HELPZ|nr:unnamed protein product [Heligmosomoides polygyrus]